MTENDKASFHGHCACSSVQYRVLREPLIVHCCHCRWCQRETGTAFALNAFVEADQVEVLQGEIERVDTPSESGKGQVIVRCTECRVALWSHYATLGDKACVVRVGTLDNPDAFPPDIHIFTESKQPWVVLPANAPCVPQFYRRSEFWSDESLRRREALLA